MDKEGVRSVLSVSTSCELADIRMVRVGEDLQGKDRIAEYVRQIKNPHLYRCGKFIIRSSYLENGLTLEDSLRKMMF